MGIGVLALFFAVLFYAIDLSGQIGLGDDSMIRMLSMVHLAYGALMYPFSMFIFHRISSRPTGLPSDATSGDRLLISLRIASVVRLAMIEGVAFFGLVVLFLAIQSGILQQAPLYWLNCCSSFIMMAFVGYAFPTRARLERLVAELGTGR
jgi:hypothetical protein